MGNRFRFNGQQYYLRARYYNPVIARFTQEDTYRGDGLNLYAYCRNNPVCYVDPSGHISCKDARKIMREAIWNGLMLQDLDAPVVSNLKAWLERKNRHGGLNELETAMARRIGLVEAGRDTIVVLPDKPHKNGTVGHWETILAEVERMKDSGEYSTIYVNMALSNEIAGATHDRRPDIMGVRHDGLIDQVEVPSRTDNVRNLRSRMEDNQGMLGDRAGSINIVLIGDNQNG